MALFLGLSPGEPSTPLSAALSAPIVTSAPPIPEPLRYVSASSLEDFECPRKWAWRKLDGVEKGSNKWAEFGSRMHAQIEAWLRDGRPFDHTTAEGRAGSASRHLLPPPRMPGMMIEEEIVFDFEGVTFGGKVDANWPYVDSAGLIAVVHDHKSCGSLQYAKLEKSDLLGHPQAPIYAVWAGRRYQTDRVLLRWAYTTRDANPKVRLSQHEISVSKEAEPALRACVPQAKQITGLVALARSRPLRALDLPYNAAVCSRFGGCAYRTRCGLSPFEEARGNDTMSQANEFLNSLLSGVPGAVVPPPAPPPSPLSVATPGTPPALSAAQAPAALQAGAQSDYEKFLAWQQSQAAPALTQPPVVSAPSVTVHFAGAVNPPEQVVAPAPATPAASATPEAAAPKTRGKKVDADPMTSPIFVRALAAGAIAAAQYLTQAADLLDAKAAK